MVLTKYAVLETLEKETSFTLHFFLIACFSILCLTAAGYVVNDILDYKADLINKPSKTFIGKSITRTTSWFIYFIINILGLVSCIYVLETLNFSLYYLAIYVITILVLYLYSKYLKRIMLVGNMVIALFCSGIILVIFFLHLEGQIKGNFMWKDLENFLNNINMFVIVFFYVIFSFTSTLIREIIKDIEDIDGDYQLDMNTLPIILGRRRARNIAIAVSLLLSVILIWVLNGLAKKPQFLFLNLYLLFLVLLPMLYFIFVLWSAKTKRQFHFLSSLMKIVMLSGIFSMILFTFV